MLNIDSIPHCDCSRQLGPGPRDPECQICREEKAADETTICHTVCLHSFHEACFTDWSKSCREQGLDVTCPICRAVLAQASREQFFTPFDLLAYVPQLEIAEDFWLPHFQRVLQQLGGRLRADFVDASDLDAASRERFQTLSLQFGIAQYLCFVPPPHFFAATGEQDSVDLLVLPDYANPRPGGPFRAPPRNPPPPDWFRLILLSAYARVLHDFI